MRLSVPSFATGLFHGVGQTSHDTDAPSTPAVDVEASHPCQFENGLLDIANLRKQDVMYMNTPKLSSQSYYLLLRDATHLLNLWHEVECAVINNDKNRVEVERSYRQEHIDYLRFAKLVQDIEQLESPSKKSFSSFQTTLENVLRGDEAALAGRPREDWAMLHGLPRVDYLVRNSVEYSIVEFVLQKFGTRVEADDGPAFVKYPLGSLARLLTVLKNCIMATFLGVPVALQALDVVSRGAIVGIYLAALLFFGILVQFLLEDHTIQTVLIMAYAAVLAANMTPK